LLISIVVCTVAVAYVDLVLFPDHNLAILYVVPVLMATFTESALLVICICALALGLDIVSLVWSHDPFLVWLLRMAALVVVCFLAIKVAGQRALIRQDVEEAERAKWNQLLLANVAHELRTPLTVILGYTQQLERDPRLPTPLRRTILTIEMSAQHMRQSIDDLAERWKPGGGETT
jgi:signal transduction histidine kinase